MSVWLVVAVAAAEEAIFADLAARCPLPAGLRMRGQRDGADGLVFWHVGKTGGTSVENAIAPFGVTRPRKWPHPIKYAHFLRHKLGAAIFGNRDAK